MNALVCLGIVAFIIVYYVVKKLCSVFNSLGFHFFNVHLVWK